MKNHAMLLEISDKIVRLFGLQFQSTHLHDLERRLKLAALELSLDASIGNINEWLSKSSFTTLELKTLSAHLTVGETYFFREKTGLELFKQVILPRLIKERTGKNEQIRIWSAGCSSGEEPYTLAIILKEHFPELVNWEISILATDINPNAIQKGLQGEYTEWSFRETESFYKNRYFVESGKNWRILPEIKKMVTFTYLNLCKNSYPSTLTNTSDIDVIFCRNVMMYFTGEVINEVSNRFFNSICQNGWLITSQVELNDEYFSPFERVQFRQGVFYRKSKKIVESVINTDKRSPAIRSLPLLNKPKEIKRIPVKSVITNTAKEPSESKNSIGNLTKGVLYALFRKGDYQKCIEGCISMINSMKPDNEIFVLLVKSFAGCGLYREGSEIIGEIILKNQATSEMYYIYASFLKEHSEDEKSEMMLKKAIYLNPNHILAYFMLGELAVKKDKKHLAVKYYETAISLLEPFSEDELVPESDGLTANGIRSLAMSIVNKL